MVLFFFLFVFVRKLVVWTLMLASKSWAFYAFSSKIDGALLMVITFFFEKNGDNFWTVQLRILLRLAHPKIFSHVTSNV